MKLTIEQVFNAYPILVAIINEKRPLPLKGAYRIARLQAKLQPEFKTIAEKRDALIVSYDYKARPDGTPDDGTTNPAQLVPSVPPEKLAEFIADWTGLGSEEIEVAVEPIPLSQLDLGDAVAGSITAADLIVLGELVRDDSDERARMPKAA